MPHPTLLPALCCVLGFAAASPRESVPIARLSGVNLTGVRYGGVDAFLRVRYAEAPVGSLRFHAAVPLPTSKLGPDAGTRPPPACTQPTPLLEVTSSEDCLFLSVYRPANAGPEARLPVIAWIHGGGFWAGAAGDAVFNGTRMVAKQGVVYVSINYRLGPLGFMSLSPEATGGHGTGGMNGVLDQITALRWVQANIAAFGGDPKRVTIMGQSAGGTSVCNLLASPLTEGLFSQAIEMSGPCIGPWGPGSTEEGKALTNQVMMAKNASTLAELRALPAGDLTWPAVKYVDIKFVGHYVDGYVLPNRTEDLFASNGPRGARGVRSVLVGATSMDGMFAFFPASLTVPSLNDSVRFSAAMLGRWGAKLGPSVIERYPFGSEGSARAFVQADADATVVCPQRELARTLRDRFGAKVFLYNFQHGDEPAVFTKHGGAGGNSSKHWASHGADVAPAFGNPPPPAWYALNRTFVNWTDVQWALSDAISGVFGQFARTGAPSAPKGIEDGPLPIPAWPEIPSALLFDSLEPEKGNQGLRVVENFRGDLCDFWDKNPVQRL